MHNRAAWVSQRNEVRAWVKLCRLTLPVACPFSLPITRKLPFRFRPSSAGSTAVAHVPFGIICAFFCTLAKCQLCAVTTTDGTFLSR